MSLYDFIDGGVTVNNFICGVFAYSNPKDLDLILINPNSPITIPIFLKDCKHETVSSSISNFTISLKATGICLVGFTRGDLEANCRDIRTAIFSGNDPVKLCHIEVDFVNHLFTQRPKIIYIPNK